MFKHSLLAVFVLFSVACASSNLVVVEKQGTNQVLAQRVVSDVYAFAPTVQRSWLEVCDIKTSTVLLMFESTDYVDCVPNATLEALSRFTTSTGYVAGAIAPVLQAGAIVGGAALLANGIRQSGSVTNNTQSGANSNTNTSTSSSSATAHGGNGGAGGRGGNGGNGGAGGSGGHGHGHDRD